MVGLKVANSVSLTEYYWVVRSVVMKVDLKVVSSVALKVD
jgi:hypothetical protein